MLIKVDPEAHHRVLKDQKLFVNLQIQMLL